VLRGTHQHAYPRPPYHSAGPEADLYLEGHDQHRGWFHSSLLLGCALYDRAPYRGLLTHGFATDGQGRKMSKSLGNTVVPQEVTDKLGAEIVRLWVAATDYSGDLNIDDKILARVVDTYRRMRNTLKFLLANISDFDPAQDTVPVHQMLEVDRYALARCAQLQADVVGHFNAQRQVFEGGHYGVYEFHPVVSRLQVYCSEDLGAFYLDVLKDRLYTTAPKSLARRSAQTALWHITHAFVRQIAPFLSFTAEEAWKLLGQGESVFTQTYWNFPALPVSDAGLLDKWARIRELRELVNKEIEAVRAQGLLGSSLQAKVKITVPPATHGPLLLDLQVLGDDLKFVLITSAVELAQGDTLSVMVTPATAAKCERCWHYRDDVGSDPDHPTICARCTSNLHGAGEVRTVA
jgi:isoleucyl-tRNA synthetase